MFLFLYFIKTITSNPFSKFEPKERLIFSGDFSEIHVNHCSFYNINLQDEINMDGGAIFIMQNASVLITQCVFDHCTAKRSGGAAYISSRYSDYSIYFIDDSPVNNSEVKYCCFQDCFCYQNSRSCSVLVISTNSLNFEYSNTLRCPGHNLIMETSQICLLLYNNEIIKYLNISQGNSKFGSGIECFYGNHFEMAFNTFMQLKGSFVSYFNYYLDDSYIYYCNYIDNVIIDDYYAENRVFTPALLYNFNQDIFLFNCAFVGTFLFPRSAFAVAYNFVSLTNCVADNIGEFYGYTINCSLNVPIDEIQTVQIDHYDCAVFYFTLDFSESDMFSMSSFFTHSSQFSESSEFSVSSQFSSSLYFSSSNYFSPSSLFSKTIYFTQSISFTQSSIFSESLQFTESNEFISDFPKGFSTTFSFVASYVLRKSVSFVASYSNSFSLVLIFRDNTYYYEYTQVASMYNIPMIIQYYSMSYVPVAFIQENVILKKKIGESQIIGIVCGAFAVLFIIMYLFVAIKRKKIFSIKKSDNEDEYLSNSSEIQETKNTIETDVNIQATMNASDIDWV